ncbi:MAG: hypothetical protein PHE58_05975, partial [Candidatus Omnitrophica bacterium]|nr:hypothetical protein [Candidatus Omnitrophota bacterium]
LGIKFKFGDLVIDPKFLPAAFAGKEIEARFPLDSRFVRVVFALKAGKKRNLFGIQRAFINQDEIVPHNGMYLFERESLRKIKNKDIRIYIELA